MNLRSKSETHSPKRFKDFLKVSSLSPRYFGGTGGKAGRDADRNTPQRSADIRTSDKDNIIKQLKCELASRDAQVSRLNKIIDEMKESRKKCNSCSINVSTSALGGAVGDEGDVRAEGEATEPRNPAGYSDEITRIDQLENKMNKLESLVTNGFDKLEKSLSSNQNTGAAQQLQNRRNVQQQHQHSSSLNYSSRYVRHNTRDTNTH